MFSRIAIVYDEPVLNRYRDTKEEKAILGVLDAVAAVRKALEELEYTVTTIPLSLPLEKAALTIRHLDTDIVFNLFEGFPGYPDTEAWLPELLREIGVPFTGCPPEALRLALHKPETKECLRRGGIITPDFQILNVENVADFRLSFPCIVKPVAEDASHGIDENSVVHDMDGLKRRVEYICTGYKNDALVEEFIDGREFNVTVTGNDIFTALPISEILFNIPSEKPRILTYAAKWDENSIYYKNTPVVCPAGLTENENRLISAIAIESYKIAGCRGYARIDMRMDRDGNPNVIEINPNPDISPNSGAARQAWAAGLSYNDFIRHIVKLALGE